MRSGKDYIIFPLDVASAAEAASFVEKLDKHVGMFKVGLELFIKEGPEIIRMIRQKSSAGIFLDLKLHDISATVEKAARQAAALDVDLLTVHASSSMRMLEGAVRGAGGRTKILGVTLLTDNDAESVAACGFRSEYSEDLLKLVMKRARMARESGCSGVVCSGQEAFQVRQEFGRDFLLVTPGIRPLWSLVAGDDQKRVTTPANAVKDGADYIVIGRPIRSADDPGMAADRVAREVEAWV